MLNILLPHNLTYAVKPKSLPPPHFQHSLSLFFHHFSSPYLNPLHLNPNPSHLNTNSVIYLDNPYCSSWHTSFDGLKNQKSKDLNTFYHRHKMNDPTSISFLDIVLNIQILDLTNWSNILWSVWKESSIFYNFHVLLFS